MPLVSSSSFSCADEIWLRMKPYFQRDYTVGTSVGFRLKIVVEDSCGIDREVFRYYQKPLNLEGVLESVFSGVCSWPDLVELPITEPEFDTSPAGFRTREIDMIVDSESMANAIWTLIKTQTDELVQTVKDGQLLEAAAAYTSTSI